MQSGNAFDKRKEIQAIVGVATQGLGEALRPFADPDE